MQGLCRAHRSSSPEKLTLGETRTPDTLLRTVCVNYADIVRPNLAIDTVICATKGDTKNTTVHS